MEVAVFDTLLESLPRRSVRPLHWGPVVALVLHLGVVGSFLRRPQPAQASRVIVIEPLTFPRTLNRPSRRMTGFRRPSSYVTALSRRSRCSIASPACRSRSSQSCGRREEPSPHRGWGRRSGGRRATPHQPRAGAAGAARGSTARLSAAVGCRRRAGARRRAAGRGHAGTPEGDRSEWCTATIPASKRRRSSRCGEPISGRPGCTDGRCGSWCKYRSNSCSGGSTPHRAVIVL
jgi:hypothetical protein